MVGSWVHLGMPGKFSLGKVIIEIIPLKSEREMPQNHWKGPKPSNECQLNLALNPRLVGSPENQGCANHRGDRFGNEAAPATRANPGDMASVFPINDAENGHANVLLEQFSSIC